MRLVTHPLYMCVLSLYAFLSQFVCLINARERAEMTKFGAAFVRMKSATCPVRSFAYHIKLASCMAEKEALAATWIGPVQCTGMTECIE